MSTVPVTEIVRITPSVIAAGGSDFVLSAIFLSTSSRVPIGTVASFGSPLAVGNFFGEDTVEARAAAKYFAGFENSNKKPGRLLFAQYNEDDVGAYMRGGDISEMTLSELQAISGSLSIVIDGVTKSGNPNLSGATSKSNAGMLIADALGLEGPQAASFTGAISTTTLTASSVTGVISPGSTVEGVGVAAGTYVVQQLTGTTGGAGTYQVSDSQTVGSVAMTANAPAVTYDSVSGGFIVISPTVGDASTMAFATGTISDDLKLTSATGAVLSQGKDAVTSPSSFMNALIQVSRAFSTFALLFNPDETGNDLRYAFAVWNGTQNNRFAYEAIDEDAAPTVTVPAASCLAQRIEDAGISGTTVNWQVAPDDPLDYANLAAFACAIAASIDFTQANGRVTFKFRRQSGMVPSVTDQTVYENLLANGYNFYAVLADGDEEWQFYVDGTISGDFRWADTYMNQIWLNGSFTRDLVELLQSAFSIPYNAAGRAQIETALAGTIDQAGNFGVYRAGVVLSSSQIAAVNDRAGKNIASTLTNQGWYLDVGVATAEVRQARGSPPMSFYYVDGESVQSFDMASIVIL